MDKIILKGVQIQTLIGWHEWERRAPRRLTLDLVIGIPDRGAGVSDHLADTIDYDHVVNTLRTVLREQRFFLLEAVAEYVAQRLLRDFAAPWVKITVIKPNVLADVDWVGVEIERTAPS